MRCATSREHPVPEPRDTFHVPARSSGRIQHMVLALELGLLAQRCRVSHPEASEILDSLSVAVVDLQRADDARDEDDAPTIDRARRDMDELALEMESARAHELAEVLAA